MSRSSITEGVLNDDVPKSQSYEMALSVSRGVYPEVPQEGDLRGMREQLGEVLRQLGLHRESRVEDGPLLVDHVHMLVSIPAKYSVAQVVGYLKGKRAIHIA